MRLRPMTLTTDDYLTLRSLVTSKLTIAFSDPKMLRSLYQELSRARLVKPEELSEVIVRMNSTITLRDLRTQAQEIYTLVYPTRADIANRRLSVLSPAGVGVLGCRSGDNIGWLARSGWRMMKIEKVAPPPDLEMSQRKSTEADFSDSDSHTPLDVDYHEHTKETLPVAGSCAHQTCFTCRRPGAFRVADQPRNES